MDNTQRVYIFVFILTIIALSFLAGRAYSSDTLSEIINDKLERDFYVQNSCGNSCGYRLPRLPNRIIRDRPPAPPTKNMILREKMRIRRERIQRHFPGFLTKPRWPYGKFVGEDNRKKGRSPLNFRR